MCRMKRISAIILLASLSASMGAMAAQSPARYKLDRIADGVYLATPGSPGPTAANIPVIVSDRDVTHFIRKD